MKPLLVLAALMIATVAWVLRAGQVGDATIFATGTGGVCVMPYGVPGFGGAFNGTAYICELGGVIHQLTPIVRCSKDGVRWFPARADGVCYADDAP